MDGILDLVMIEVLMVAILSGFPVTFSIAGVAILFALLGWQTGVMNISLLGALAQCIFRLLTDQILIAIPLFVFMGAILEKSRIVEKLLETMAKAFGSVHGHCRCHCCCQGHDSPPDHVEEQTTIPVLLQELSVLPEHLDRSSLHQRCSLLWLT